MKNEKKAKSNSNVSCRLPLDLYVQIEERLNLQKTLLKHSDALTFAKVAALKSFEK